jgi:2-C-methyl-D-erythritol 4-phosphate cytidylyltransferase
MNNSLMPEKRFAIIVAGGRGNRMNNEMPKQFLEIAGRPLLMHTVEAFYKFSPDLSIILVLPEDQIDYWSILCQNHGFNIPVHIQKGGKSRFQSVRNGLKSIDGEGLVAVHDGVRPLVSNELIAASFLIAAMHGSAVAAVRLKESIRIIDKDSTRAVDRARFRVIQTPQTFKVSLLKKAYEIEEDESMTDDASVVERAGHKISLFEGSYFNIKITTPEDLWMAEKLFGYQNKENDY